MSVKSRGVIVQVTNISPTSTMEQMRTLFGHIGVIDDIVVYPLETDEFKSKVCYVKYADAVNVEVSLHLNGTIFLDRALIVLPLVEGRDEIPSEEYANLVRAPPNTAAGILPRSDDWPLDVISMVVGRPGEQAIHTIEPRLVTLGFPMYPPLPAATDVSRIEEIRRSVIITNLDSKTNGQEILDFFNTHAEVKCVRMAGTEDERAAYVEFTEQPSILKAFGLMGATIRDRQIMVQHSNCAIIKPTTPTDKDSKKSTQIQKSSADNTANDHSHKDRSRSRSRTKNAHSKRSRSRSRRSRSRSKHSRTSHRSKDRRTSLHHRSRSKSHERRRRRSRSRSRDRRRNGRDRSRSRRHKRSRYSRSISDHHRRYRRSNSRSRREKREQELKRYEDFKNERMRRERDLERSRDHYRSRDRPSDRSRIQHNDRDRERERSRNRDRDRSKNREKDSRSKKTSNRDSRTKRSRSKSKEKKNIKKSSKNINSRSSPTVSKLDCELLNSTEQSESLQNGINLSPNINKNGDISTIHNELLQENKKSVAVVGVKLAGPEDMDAFLPLQNPIIDNDAPEMQNNSPASDSSAIVMEADC